MQPGSDRLRTTQRSDTERIARLVPIELEGRCWYALEDVCAALRVQRSKCAGLVAEEHRRRYTQFRRGYRSRRIELIDRAGVEALVIRWSQEPRAAVMARLPTLTP